MQSHGSNWGAEIFHPLEFRCERSQMVQLESSLSLHEGDKGEDDKRIKLICLKELSLNDNSPTVGGTAA